jgi:hypothetical protein
MHFRVYLVLNVTLYLYIYFFVYTEYASGATRHAYYAVVYTRGYVFRGIPCRVSLKIPWRVFPKIPLCVYQRNPHYVYQEIPYVVFQETPLHASDWHDLVNFLRKFFFQGIHRTFSATLLTTPDNDLPLLDIPYLSNVKYLQHSRNPHFKSLSFPDYKYQLSLE